MTDKTPTARELYGRSILTPSPLIKGEDAKALDAKYEKLHEQRVERRIDITATSVRKIVDERWDRYMVRMKRNLERAQERLKGLEDRWRKDRRKLSGDRYQRERDYYLERRRKIRIEIEGYRDAVRYLEREYGKYTRVKDDNIKFLESYDRNVVRTIYHNARTTYQNTVASLQAKDKAIQKLKEIEAEHDIDVSKIGRGFTTPHNTLQQLSSYGIITADGKFYPTMNKNFVPQGYTSEDIIGHGQRINLVRYEQSGDLKNYLKGKKEIEEIIKQIEQASPGEVIKNELIPAEGIIKPTQVEDPGFMDRVRHAAGVALQKLREGEPLEALKELHITGPLREADILREKVSNVIEDSFEKWQDRRDEKAEEKERKLVEEWQSIIGPGVTITIQAKPEEGSEMIYDSNVQERLDWERKALKDLGFTSNEFWSKLKAGFTVPETLQTEVALRRAEEAREIEKNSSRIEEFANNIIKDELDRQLVWHYIMPFVNTRDMVDRVVEAYTINKDRIETQNEEALGRMKYIKIKPEAEATAQRALDYEAYLEESKLDERVASALKVIEISEEKGVPLTEAQVNNINRIIEENNRAVDEGEAIQREYINMLEKGNISYKINEEGVAEITDSQFLKAIEGQKSFREMAEEKGFTPEGIRRAHLSGKISQWSAEMALWVIAFATLNKAGAAAMAAIKGRMLIKPATTLATKATATAGIKRIALPVAMKTLTAGVTAANAISAGLEEYIETGDLRSAFLYGGIKGAIVYGGLKVMGLPSKIANQQALRDFKIAVQKVQQANAIHKPELMMSLYKSTIYKGSFTMSGAQYQALNKHFGVTSLVTKNNPVKSVRVVTGVGNMVSRPHEIVSIYDRLTQKWHFNIVRAAKPISKEVGMMHYTILYADGQMRQIMVMGFGDMSKIKGAINFEHMVSLLKGRKFVIGHKGAHSDIFILVPVKKASVDKFGVYKFTKYTSKDVEMYLAKNYGVQKGWQFTETKKVYPEAVKQFKNLKETWINSPTVGKTVTKTVLTEKPIPVSMFQNLYIKSPKNIILWDHKIRQLVATPRTEFLGKIMKGEKTIEWGYILSAKIPIVIVPNQKLLLALSRKRMLINFIDKPTRAILNNKGTVKFIDKVLTNAAKGKTTEVTANTIKGLDKGTKGIILENAILKHDKKLITQIMNLSPDVKLTGKKINNFLLTADPAALGLRLPEPTHIAPVFAPAKLLPVIPAGLSKAQTQIRMRVQALSKKLNKLERQVLQKPMMDRQQIVSTSAALDSAQDQTGAIVDDVVKEKIQVPREWFIGIGTRIHQLRLQLRARLDLLPFDLPEKEEEEDEKKISKEEEEKLPTVSYIKQVRKKGKWITRPGRFATYGEAMAAGVVKVSTTLRASFRIRKVNKRPNRRLSQLQVMSAMRILRERFYKSEKETGVWIEKKEYRLSSKTEVKAIQEARKKAEEERRFWFGD